jgi:hypothetical protein
MTAPKHGPAEFVVLSFERPEGERFAIFRPDDWIRSATPSHWATIRDRAVAMEQFVRSLELLTEESLRTRLEGLGIVGIAVNDHIARARTARQLNRDGSWELVTALGYRNDEGQVVIARTARTGSEPEQRVFLMRCSVCGHRYGTYGSDIPHRCCPKCQDGPPGLQI